MSDNEDEYEESVSGSESGSEYAEEEKVGKPFIKLNALKEVGDADEVVDDEEEVEDEDDENIDDDDDEEEVEDDDDDDASIHLQEMEEEKNKDEKNEDKKGKKNDKQKKVVKNEDKVDHSDEDDDDETDEHYLQKFDIDINKNYLMEVHPECLHHNYDEIEALTVIIRDSNNIIIDPLHRTIPFLTKYERARVLGQRAKQINMGAQAFVKIPDNVMDGIVVAELELKEKKIPFIIKRPLPNGACEYWNVNDLENILY